MTASIIALNCDCKRTRQIVLSTCIMMKVAIDDKKTCRTSYRR